MRYKRSSKDDVCEEGSVLVSSRFLAVADVN